MTLTGTPGLIVWGAIQIWVDSPWTQSAATAPWPGRVPRRIVMRQMNFFTAHSPQSSCISIKTGKGCSPGPKFIQRFREGGSRTAMPSLSQSTIFQEKLYGYSILKKSSLKVKAEEYFFAGSCPDYLQRDLKKKSPRPLLWICSHYTSNQQQRTRRLLLFIKMHSSIIIFQYETSIVSNCI